MPCALQVIKISKMSTHLDSAAEQSRTLGFIKLKNQILVQMTLDHVIARFTKDLTANSTALPSGATADFIGHFIVYFTVNLTENFMTDFRSHFEV